MALRAMLSFDNVANVTQLDSKLSAVATAGYARGAGTTLAASAGRYGGRALRFSNTGTHYVRLNFNDQASWRVGYWLKITGFNSGQRILSLKDSAAEQLIVTVTTDGVISVFRGSGAALLASSAAGAIVLNTWHFVELKATIDNVGSFDVFVDGVSVVSGSGVDTDQQNTSHADIVTIGSDPTGGHGSDCGHIYILDGTGGSPYNDTLGFIRIVTDAPTSDGNASDFTPSVTGNNNYEQVDEATPNDDTDYNVSNTVSHDDLFNFSSITETGTPIAVQDVVVARKDDAGARQIALIMLSGISGATINEGATKSLSETYEYFAELRIQDPEGPTDWTDSSNVDAAQSGYRLKT